MKLATLSYPTAEPSLAPSHAGVREGSGIWAPLAGRIEWERTDIAWFDSTPEHLSLAISFRNPNREATMPAFARISAAPLGAFVPWQPLRVLPLPALPGGGTTVLRADVTAPFRGLQPRQRRLPGVFRSYLRRLGFSLDVTPSCTHWAGNIDVLVHDRAVERHMSMGLRLFPGAANVADFRVGDRADDYMFEVTGDILGWSVQLRSVSPLALFRGKPVPLGSWVRFPGQQVLCLVATPPPRCAGGHLDIHVRQRSTGRDAVVEFGFAA